MPSGAGSAPDLVLRSRRLPHLFYFLLSLGFAVGGGFMIADGQWTGWFVAGFFGLCALVLPIVMLPGASYLRLTAEGFTVCSLYRSHGYAWADVGPFFPGAVPGRKMVFFNFVDPGYNPRARAVARVLTGAEGALPDSYGMTVEDLAAIMNEWRETVFPADAAAGPVALSPAEISERLPVWQAISELWLDTEQRESDLEYLAGRLTESRYSLSELEDIYLFEVAPAVHENLRQVAGHWAGFDPEWLAQTVLQNLAEPHHRARALRQQVYMTELVAEDWRQVKRLVEKLRQAGRRG